MINRIKNIFSKSQSQKEVDVLIKELQDNAVEFAQIKQYVGELIKKKYKDECFETSDISPSDELIKRFWIKRGKTKLYYVWGLLENSIDKPLNNEVSK